MPGVEPLDNTPDKIDIDQRLSSVLGHETTTAPAAKPVSRCRRHLPLNEVSTVRFRYPPQLRSCLWIGRYPNLLNRRKRKYPPSRSKAKSVSSQIRTWHILFNKKKLSKKLFSEHKELQTNSFIFFFSCSCYCFTTIIFVVLYNMHWD